MVTSREDLRSRDNILCGSSEIVEPAVPSSHQYTTLCPQYQAPKPRSIGSNATRGGRRHARQTTASRYTSLYRPHSHRGAWGRRDIHLGSTCNPGCGVVYTRHASIALEEYDVVSSSHRALYPNDTHTSSTCLSLITSMLRRRRRLRICLSPVTRAHYALVRRFH